MLTLKEDAKDVEMKILFSSLMAFLSVLHAEATFEKIFKQTFTYSKMPEKDNLFSNKVKFTGVVNFGDFYKFCYDWQTEELKYIVSEDKYSEKLVEEGKNLEIEWTAFRKITDYFKFEIKTVWKVLGLTKVETTQNGVKVKADKGIIEINVKGNLVKDYQGRFEKTAFQKFLRGIYEKWVIPSRVDEYEDKLISNCEEFINQAKAYLDLTGKK